MIWSRRILKAAATISVATTATDANIVSQKQIQTVQHHFRAGDKKTTTNRVVLRDGGRRKLQINYEMFKSIAQESNLCIDVKDGNTTNFAQLQFNDCNGGDNQMFHYDAIGGKVYSKLKGNFCLEMDPVYGVFMHSPCVGTWDIYESGSNGNYIKNIGDDGCVGYDWADVDSMGGTLSNETPLVRTGCGSINGNSGFNIIAANQPDDPVNEPSAAPTEQTAVGSPMPLPDLPGPSPQTNNNPWKMYGILGGLAGFIVLAISLVCCYWCYSIQRAKQRADNQVDIPQPSVSVGSAKAPESRTGTMPTVASPVSHGVPVDAHIQSTIQVEDSNDDLSTLGDPIGPYDGSKWREQRTQEPVIDECTVGPSIINGYDYTRPFGGNGEQSGAQDIDVSNVALAGFVLSDDDEDEDNTFLERHGPRRA